MRRQTNSMVQHLSEDSLVPHFAQERARPFLCLARAIGTPSSRFIKSTSADIAFQHPERCLGKALLLKLRDHLCKEQTTDSLTNGFRVQIEGLDFASLCGGIGIPARLGDGKANHLPRLLGDPPAVIGGKLCQLCVPCLDTLIEELRQASEVLIWELAAVGPLPGADMQADNRWYVMEAGRPDQERQRHRPYTIPSFWQSIPCGLLIHQGPFSRVSYDAATPGDR